MSPRSPENLVNVSAIAFLLDAKTHVEPMGEYILVKKLENGVMILLMDTPSHRNSGFLASNIDPCSKFLHRYALGSICNQVIIVIRPADPIAPHTRRYTTL